MAVTTDVVHKIWNDEGWGYEVGPDADTGFALEVRYYEESFGTPIKYRMTFSKDEAYAIATALLKLAKDM